MRRGHRRDIIIELTSLLDVVMIIIFAVMIENTKLVQASQEELAQANTAMQTMQSELDEKDAISEELMNALAKLDEGDRGELLEQIDRFETSLEAYEYLDLVMITVNVKLENKYNNTSRYLSFGEGVDTAGYHTYEIKKGEEEDWADAVNQLKIYVGDVVSKELKEKDQDKSIYLIFSSDYSKVYSDDFNDVKNALMNAARKNSKVIFYDNQLNAKEKK